MIDNKVLVVGSGAREHAIAWKLAQSTHVKKVYVAPGNAGTALEPKCENVELDISNPVSIARFAWPRKINLTVVGPDQPLADGIVNVFEDAGLRILGPRSEPAKLESSKTFAKQILVEAGVNTAPFGSFTNCADAEDYIRKNFKDGERIVIKADGLALGKGVFIKNTIHEAIEIVEKLIVGNLLGPAGFRVVIEKFIEGIEVSLTALISGDIILLFPLSQDYKKLNTSEFAPNTGGMGAYSPIFGNSDLYTFAFRTIHPVIAKLIEKGIFYKGFLYAGLVIDKDAVPHVLEFNARLGDPEGEILLSRLKSDFYELCSSAIDQQLNGKNVKWLEEHAAGVVLASGGYPGQIKTGFPIVGLRKSDDTMNTKVFHYATKKDEKGTILTNSGRVLFVCGLDDDIPSAANRAYERIARINFEGMNYRDDIGKFVSRTV